VDEHDNLFVTGRLKDLIIVAGKNHYPQDIEETVESCDLALRPHASAAVAVERGNRETLLVLAEVQRRLAADFDAKAVASLIRRRIAQRHELDLGEIVFLQRGQLPMTTSGKIRRRAARERLLAGELQILARVAF
jgi:acyl-CoA synthetase (AMP-forming)/AMP-acid ligase II